MITILTLSFSKSFYQVHIQIGLVFWYILRVTNILEISLLHSKLSQLELSTTHPSMPSAG